MKPKIFLLLVFVCVLAIVIFAKIQNSASSNQNETEPVTTLDRHKHSIDDPLSIWVIVNKKRPLSPNNYAPSDLVIPQVALQNPGNESMQLRRPAALALQHMFVDAKAAGIHLELFSGYRSYSYQITAYDSEIKAYGRAQADRESARPGYSEHQTGLAADISAKNGQCDTQSCFANTPEGKWLAANAYKYGFILSYPNHYEHITGYMFEPWHYRYVGTVLSNYMHDNGVPTLYQFFGIPAAPDY